MQTENLNQDENEIVEQEQLDYPEDLETSQNEAASDFKVDGETEAPTQKTIKRETPDNTGSLFKNDRKSKEVHPDVTGSVKVNGVEYYVSGWRKSGAKGDFYSLSFRSKENTAVVKELI